MQTGLESPGPGGAAFPDTVECYGLPYLSQILPHLELELRGVLGPQTTLEWVGNPTTHSFNGQESPEPKYLKFTEKRYTDMHWKKTYTQVHSFTCQPLERYLFAFPQLFQWHTSPISQIHTVYNFNTNSALKLNLPEILPHLFFILVDNNTNRS